MDTPAYLRASRDADRELYYDLMAMADRESDPYLRGALCRRANQYSPHHEADAARVIYEAFDRAIERVERRRALAHANGRSNGARPLALVDRRSEARMPPLESTAPWLR
jgi:hypothetical protein